MLPAAIIKYYIYNLLFWKLIKCCSRRGRGESARGASQEVTNQYSLNSSETSAELQDAGFIRRNIFLSSQSVWNDLHGQRNSSQSRCGGNTVLIGNAVDFPRGEGGCGQVKCACCQLAVSRGWKVCFLRVRQNCLCKKKQLTTSLSYSEVCSENKIATTKYPCVKSTGEVTTCYR